MTVTASYASNVERGETSASVGPSSSHLPLAVLDPGRGKSLPFATPPNSLLPPGHTFGALGGWSDNAFSYVTYGHFAQVYSEFARVLALVDRATDRDLSNPLDDLIIHTVAADPTSAMEWTVRTYTLESTPDSSIPILTVDGYDNFEDSEG